LSHQAQLAVIKSFNSTVVTSADSCFEFIDSLLADCAILHHTARVE